MAMLARRIRPIKSPSPGWMLTDGRSPVCAAVLNEVLWSLKEIGMRKWLLLGLLLLVLIPVQAQDTLRMSFLTQYASISRVEFSPDGQSLVSVSFVYEEDSTFHGSVQIWD